MKKILLTTLNAKYVHTSLALWYLLQFCGKEYSGLTFREFNINQDLSWISGEIYLEQADVVAFSCNIWNIEQILVLSQRLKALNPGLIILLGGPEVSADPVDIMKVNSEIDFIVVGEGELTFQEWLRQFHDNQPDWNAVKGLVYRKGNEIFQNEARPPISDLSILPFPYPDNLEPFQRKLVYYETSRGCPFSCQYCLSANEHGVRFFPLEQVKQDLLKFIEAGIRQIKFVDRSFNCNPAWAKEIWRFLLNHPGQTNFHFEIVGDLLDEESIEILAQAPPGLFQFEIGVQTTHGETLNLIRRKMDFQRLGEQVGELINRTPVFVHLDLIAGLPAEDYPTFAHSFNDNMVLKPHRLQLGFLKLLKGSGLRCKAAEYGYIFTRETPYEVMANHWLNYKELLKLKTIEDLLERYYNSRRFQYTFAYLIPQYPTPFQFFELLAVWWKAQGYDQVSHKSKDLYRYLLQFYESSGKGRDILRNQLKYDLLLNERMVELPDWAGLENPDLHQNGYRFWQNPKYREEYVSEFQELSIREIQRKVIFEEFDYNPIAVSNAPLSEPSLEKQVILFVYQGLGVKSYHLNWKEFFG